MKILTWFTVGFIILSIALIGIRVEYIEDETIKLWDVHIFKIYIITYTHDESEGPVFWLSDENGLIKRWPEFRPTPDWLQYA
ncbi:MAG: hypothetical protein JW953_17605 [Anaerolineae bacterium]|nr:hypothetical protein [Anaerolineae bacterium]